MVPDQDRSLYCEDWGEALTNRSDPVICVADLQSGAVGVLDGVPPDVSPGQVRMQKLTERSVWTLVFVFSVSRLCGLPAVTLCFLLAGTMNPSDLD